MYLDYNSHEQIEFDYNSLFKCVNHNKMQNTGKCLMFCSKRQLVIVQSLS